jgi:CBS-domain-containing membrane protein
MRKQVVALRVAGAVFGLMCLAQLTRVLAFPGVVVLVGGYRFPLWPSMVAAVVLGGLALWMWRVSYAADT